MSDYKAREKHLKTLARQTRVLVRGGKRIVRVQVNVPMDEYHGLQRFDGVTDSDKVNTLIHIANKRLAELEAKQHREAAEIRPPIVPHQG